MNTSTPAGRGNPPTKESQTEQQKKVKKGVEATLTSIQDWSGNTTKQWRNYPEHTTEQEREGSLKTSYTQKNQLQHNLSTSAQQNTRCGWSYLSHLAGGKDPPKKDPTTIKTQRHTESQLKRQPKTSELRRLRRQHHWIPLAFHHRSSYHKPRESEHINLRS